MRQFLSKRYFAAQKGLIQGQFSCKLNFWIIFENVCIVMQDKTLEIDFDDFLANFH